ncbi:MAG: hypothetical protein HMLKMBBP_00284 [Planctomycetes bacterium]|nr:hypothetical protein [Planctomycetota bacterium]
MRRAFVFAGVVATACASPPEPRPEPAPPAAAAAPAAPASRADLVIPDDVWAQVLAGAERNGRAVGFTFEEMKWYGGREHLLRPIENLFRDARVLPRETGRITDGLIAAAQKGRLDEVAQTCFALTDLPAGRMYAAPKGPAWGWPGISDGATLEEADRALGTGLFLGPQPRALPLVRFILRLEIAHRVAEPWLRAGREDALRILKQHGVEPSLEGMRPFVGPWTDDAESQSATREHAVFDLMSRHDRGPIAYGTALFLAHLSNALEELGGWQPAASDGQVPQPLRFGSVTLLGAGDDVPAAGAGIVVDLGGNDRWGRRAGCAEPAGALLSVAIDLGGDDTWTSRDEPTSGSRGWLSVGGPIASGVLGLGIVVDRAGTDRYEVASDGLGRGLFGAGVLWDMAGDDTYTVRTKWGQGAAHVGIGVLLDSSGNDRYECAEQSQGLGSTLATGLLLDLAGNDVYHCRDDGNVSELYLNQSVAMAQGCGYGRRADLGDGRSLAGGWGLLVDAAGDDRYHAQCWSQGAGYWWGVGVLEDRGGDDVYENGKYSSGAGAHYAIGVHVDLAGDDRHNEGVPDPKNQYQGHARDGSIGVFVDGGGNDRYVFRPNCAGSADLASVGLFWERDGDDVYEFKADPPPAPDAPPPGPNAGDWPRPPFGTATIYRTPNRSFRDDQHAVGVFLDTGGRDTYPAGSRAANGTTWRERPWPNSFGFGLDAGGE